MKTKHFDPYDLSKKTIDDVPVYYKNLPWAPCIHIRVVFNVGAFHDPVGKEGLSHFLEHMIFDGSPTLPDKKAVRAWQKKYTLNTWNAWTNYYNTTYWCKTLPEHFDEVLRGMKDMIFSPLLRAEDIEHERKVITQEAWSVYKNEKFLNYIRECQQNLYATSNMARVFSALGWPETVATLSQDDVQKWHDSMYGKDNMYIVVVGNITDKNLVALKAFLKNIPKGKKTRLPTEKIITPKELVFKRSADDIGDPKEQAEVSIVRTGKILNKETSIVAGVFARLLSDVLYEKIREERGMCYSLRFQSFPSKSYSKTVFNVDTDEKNIDVILEEFWKIVSDFQSGVYKEKFGIIKHLMIEGTKASEFLSGDIATKSVKDISHLDGDISTLDYSLDVIEKTTYADIVRFSKDVFNKKYVFTEIIVPGRK